MADEQGAEVVATAAAVAQDSAPAQQKQTQETVADYVVDELPSAWLKLTMSRRVKERAISEDKLVPFLADLLRSSPPDASVLPPSASADTIVQRVLYGSGSRRVVVLALVSEQVAQQLRQQLNGKPCALIGQRLLYAEFALRRKDQEARDRLLRVASVSRGAAPASSRVPGLRFHPEFVSKEQEAACLAFFDAQDGTRWAHTIKSRQVQHFGYEFSYDTRRCDPQAPLDEPLPAVLEQLVDQVARSGLMDGDTPDQITVNEYLPGQGIAAHVDTHSAFTTTIASLSLCSEVVMEFRHPDGVQSQGVLLPPRSLAVMSGPSRYEWTHAIAPRAFDVVDGRQVPRQRRLSITFRKLRSGSCTCVYPAQCDTPRDAADETTKETEEETQGLAPTSLEQQFVHDFYETVAAHFSSTRHSPWPRVAQFVSALSAGSVIADLGCGNGKYMKCVDASKSFVVGGDRSSRLVRICGERGLDAMVCDALAVPLRSGSCDAALSIAVLHHLSTLTHRLAAVQELLRVLRVGGRGVVYAWAHEQMKGSRRRFDDDRQDFMVPWNLDKRFAFSSGDDSEAGIVNAMQQEHKRAESEDPRSVEDGGDQKDGGESSGECTKKTATERVVVQRYCHMFKKGELEDLVTRAGNAEVEESYYDESNWAVVLRRTY